jgi:hypothetical protein
VIKVSATFVSNGSFSMVSSYESVAVTLLQSSSAGSGHKAATAVAAEILKEAGIGHQYAAGTTQGQNHTG